MAATGEKSKSEKENLVSYGPKKWRNQFINCYQTIEPTSLRFDTLTNRGAGYVGVKKGLDATWPQGDA